MQLWHTYFITSFESDYTGPATSPIVDSSDNLIKMVPHAFAADMFIEGSGRLSDGRALNVAGNACGRESFDVAGYHGRPCYSVMPPSKPWGSASNGRPLVPLRTLAVDRSIIPLGTRVFLRQFAGLSIPRVGEIGGFTHDGWFTADDTGCGIRGPHIDVFAGSRPMMRALEAIFPTDWRSATGSGVGPGFDAVVGGAATVTGTTPPDSGSGGAGGAWLAALSLIAMGVGAAIWLERRKTHTRSNPSDFLVRTTGYTPQTNDVRKPHLGSMWLKDRAMAEDFATDLSRRNHARVVVEEVDGDVRLVYAADDQR